MRYAFDTPQFGPYANPRLLADLAREAEDAGWDAFFLWDHVQVGWPDPVADPWIALAAMASVTSRILLGPMVTPIFRRHPEKLAREAVTLDHLSGGRVVLGVGAGGDVFGEVRTFDGPQDARVRADMLDEGLAILPGLFSGEKFSYEGKYFRVRDAQFLPIPVQKPRIPIWVAATWPNKRPLRRAARFEGVVPIAGDIEHALTAEVIAEIAAYVKAHRASTGPFEIVVAGETTGDSASDRAIVEPYAAAGATWWFESALPWRTPLDRVRERLKKGPPRL